MRSQVTISRGVCAALLVTLTFSLTACFEEKDKQAAPQTPPPLVGTLELKKENVPLQATYMGQTLGYLSVEVRAQTSGILKRRFFKEGDYVYQGQTLFEIDPASAQAALDQAKAQLTVAQTEYANAQREWNRIQPLYARNAVSQKDRDTAKAAYDSAKAQVASAQARVNEAQIQLDYTNVVAPISGFTSLAARDEGDLITMDSQGSLLTTINQTDPMYVTFAIPSADMMRMKRLVAQGKAKVSTEGTPARLAMLEGGVYQYPGFVTFVDTQVEPQTSVIRARAQFPNPESSLLPGQYASVTISGTSLEDVIMVPQTAVMNTAQGTMVYTVGKDNVATLTPVTLGDIFGSEFIVTEGLEPGTVIVVEGTNKVRPGAPIQGKPVQRPSRELALPTPDSVAMPPSDDKSEVTLTDLPEMENAGNGKTQAE
ncbi:MAG TPA: efflux RND transporter periplasmic adaptor subunit [Candidatus Mailhella merdavium]|nr:efflux RND transporter periplasmic adaptor subunit [Candidatus Mailhella merdavium]